MGPNPVAVITMWHDNNIHNVNITHNKYFYTVTLVCSNSVLSHQRNAKNHSSSVYIASTDNPPVGIWKPIPAGKRHSKLTLTELEEWLTYPFLHRFQIDFQPCVATWKKIILIDRKWLDAMYDQWLFHWIIITTMSLFPAKQTQN